MRMWRYIQPPLLFLDKLANTIIILVRDRRLEWGTISARWGREIETNPFAKTGCPVLDVIDPTTDDHCGDAARGEGKKGE
jgi:hypothetical protein